MSACSPNGFTDRSFAFLAGLEKNNNAEWFNENKAVFKDSLERPFAEVLEEVSSRLSEAPVPLRGSRTTMFRMNRDVRFSADRSPYKTAVGGLLTPSGTKVEEAGLVYLHFGVDGGFVAAGLHHPSPKQLGPLRDQMLEDPEEFDAVVEGLREAGLGLDPENSLKTMPRGYSEHAEHRLAWALRLKELITSRRLPRTAWKSGDIADRVEEFARGVTPLLRFVRSG